MSVGIGNWLDLYELEMMASYPTERNMIRVQNFDSLNSIVNTIRDAACDSKHYKREKLNISSGRYFFLSKTCKVENDIKLCMVFHTV